MSDKQTNQTQAGAPTPMISPDQMSKQDRKQRKGHGFAIFMVVLLLVVGIVYTAGTFYFAHRFVPGTTVNGIDVSMMTEEELAARVDADAMAWKEQVTSPGGFNMTITAADAGLKVDAEELAQAAHAKTDPMLWPLDLINHRSIVVGETVDVDEAAVKSFVNAAVEAFNQTATMPTDANITYVEEKGEFAVVGESTGTALNADIVGADVVQDAREFTTSRVLDDAALAAPAQLAEDAALVDAINTANLILNREVAVVHDGKEIARVNKDLLRDWIIVGDGWAVTMDGEAIWDWVDANVSKAVVSEDDLHVYGLDVDTTAWHVQEALEQGKGNTVEATVVVTTEKPPLTPEAASRGRHLDVNISYQYARFYDASGKIIWETYIVTGNTSEGRDTPCGDFSILSKQRSQTLIGDDEDGDGEPDYRSYVEYWMPFRSGGYGLHDASWRSSFGGTIYQYAGSHGCINLPSAKAAELYNIVNVGDKVYVHK